MPKRLSLAAALLLGGLAAGPAGAQVYKWVDDKGVTHYGERPPPGAAAARDPKKLSIPLVGNDKAEAAAGCYTIQCQYDRLRKDRLEREAEWRRETETRLSIAEARRATEAAARPPDPPAYEPVYPVYRRARVLPLPTPRSNAPQEREPSVRLKVQR